METVEINIMSVYFLKSSVLLFSLLSVWLSTQNHGSMLISDRQTVPFLPANPEYSATRNQVTAVFAAVWCRISHTLFESL